MLFQNAAHPDIAGRQEGRATNPLAAKICRLSDAFRRIDENEAVAKSPMQKHRQRSPGHPLIAGGEIRGGIELADIEFLTVSHAVMTFARTKAAEHNEVDSIRLDCAVAERANEVIVPGGKVELQSHAIRFARNLNRATCFEHPKGAAPLPFSLLLRHRPAR